MAQYIDYGTAKLMMATAARHLGDDVSRNPAEPCWVWGEQGDWYIGRWADADSAQTDVRFSKATTREITATERAAKDAEDEQAGRVIRLALKKKTAPMDERELRRLRLLGVVDQSEACVLAAFKRRAQHHGVE